MHGATIKHLDQEIVVSSPGDGDLYMTVETSRGKASVILTWGMACELRESIRLVTERTKV